jgi:carboxypeptidase Taq
MPSLPAYSTLEALFTRLSHVEQASGMLHWDMATMMPPGGAGSRAEQLATLKALHHQLLTGPEVKDLLAAADEESLDDWQRANLREMRRQWVHAAAVPSSLVEALSRACSASEMTWRKARPAADFAAAAPLLGEVLRLTRQVAEIKSQALGLDPYDALLDQYEPGGRVAEIDPVFDDLAAFLPEFLRQALTRQQSPRQGPSGPFAVERQRALGLRMMETLGFDFEHGRLDVSHHPFCGGTPDDIRITTRYDEQDFMKSLMGVLHETGHALYERGLPAAWRHQPVGRARGMSLHESQSLLMEMQACRSRAFLSFAAPLMAKAFDAGGKAGWDAETLYTANVRVEPGFIRVDADEVTYPAHVILRYRLEKALVAGEIQVADIPAAWTAGFRALLGMVPPDDRLGCLQDIHWYDGAIGYFPTYTLGAMTAAQLFDAARRAVPDLEHSIGRGDFRPLLSWLRQHVHGKGSLLATGELLTQATGRPLDSRVFKDHLQRRYLS